MGSWNGTCFLSHLSITHGDRVVMQLLIPNTGKGSRNYVDLEAYTPDQDPRDINGSCNANDELAPFAPVLTGIYNDYGSMDQVEKNTALVFFKKYVKALVANKQLVSLAPVEKWLGRVRKGVEPPLLRGIDATYPVDVDNIDEFLGLVERGSILVKSIFGHWVRLRFVLMHEDIHDNVVAETTKMKGWDGKCIFDAYLIRQREIVDFYVNDVLPTKKGDHRGVDPGVVDEIIAEAEKKGSDMTKAKKARESMQRMFVNDIIWNDFSYSEYRPECINYIKDFCEDKKNKQHVETIVSGLYDVLAMVLYISKMRRSWAMTSGCGSQDDNIGAVAKHNTMVNSFIKDYKKELKKRYAE
jgi:hypothetical protein